MDADDAVDEEEIEDCCYVEGFNANKRFSRGTI